MSALGVTPSSSPSKGVARAQALHEEVSVAREALEEEVRRGDAELARREELEAEVERREESIEALRQQFSAMRVQVCSPTQVERVLVFGSGLGKVVREGWKRAV